MAYKITIHKGYYEGFFKAKLKDLQVPNKLNEIDFYDIELIDYKKFQIKEVIDIEESDESKFTSNKFSKHVNIRDVETHYLTNNEQFNPKNKYWDNLTINNPEFPDGFLSKESDEFYYGKIQGEAVSIEKKPINNPSEEKTIVSNIVKPNTISSFHQSKGCYESRFDRDGCFSTTRPLSQGCFSSGCSRGCCFPSNSSCYGCGSGCFNAQPSPCFNTSCFGCFNGCFQIPLLRVLFNLLGILGLLYLLFLLLCNLNLSSSLKPTIDPQSDDELIVEEIPVEDEIILDPIEDSDTQSLNTGTGNKIYLTVGDFDWEDNDRVNLYFNDNLLASNYELVSDPLQIELSSLLVNQINTLRIEALSNGDLGSCTPILFACSVCGGEDDCQPAMQLELRAEDPKRKFGEIYFFVEENDCLEQ